MIRPAREKLAATLALIDRLRSGTFPYPHADDVLAHIETILKAADERLDPEADENYLRNEYNVVTGLLNRFLPYLGFLYRSKSSANAFELYGPLLRLVRELVHGDTKLVLASEWEFSPFTYVGSHDLRDTILVGLPASESSNVLLIPLAGHEVGHHLWAARNLTARFQALMWQAIIRQIEANWTEYRKRFPDDPSEINTLLQDAFFLERWSTPQFLAMRQLEEVLCDLVGVRLFGQAYFHAFAYLLSPGPASRSPEYPPLMHRITFMRQGADRWGYTLPSGYEAIWTPYHAPDPGSDTDFLAAIVDDAVDASLDQLLQVVDEIIPQDRFPIVRSEEVDAVERALEILTPISTPAGLPTIVNAGWRIYFRQDVWASYSSVGDRKKAVVLNELLLKSAQVTEVLSLLREDHT